MCLHKFKKCLRVALARLVHFNASEQRQRNTVKQYTGGLIHGWAYTRVGLYKGGLIQGWAYIRKFTV
jgi:hypothetical protein